MDKKLERQGASLEGPVSSASVVMKAKSHDRFSVFGSMMENQRGVALPVSLLALLMITLLGLALTTTGIVSTSVSINDRETSQALHLSVSGIHHANAIIFSQGLDFDDYLQGGDGTACNGDELSDTPSAPLSAGDEITAASSGGEALGVGRYEVSVCDDPADPSSDPNDDDNDRILVISTGFGANGSTATIETFIFNFTLPAIVVEANLRINGNAQILGDEGSVHTNGDRDIPGNPCMEQYFSAVGSIASGGSPSTGSGCPSGSDATPDGRPNDGLISVPLLDPLDFKADADYVMKTNGHVYDSSSTCLTCIPPSSVDNWKDGGGNDLWQYDPGNQAWIAKTDDLPNGIYYSEAAADLPTSPGLATCGTGGVDLTLIAEGWVQIGGNPCMNGKLVKNGAKYAVISGHDLKLNGNKQVDGVNYAGHQLSISGDPIINGQVFAADLADTDYPNPGDNNPVPRLAGGFMEFSGNPVITYDGASGLGDLDVVAWRECRGPNPAAPCN